MNLLSTDYRARAQAFIRQRKTAYQLAFNIKFRAWLPKSAYRIVFGGPAGNMVLQDLAKFCRGAESCFDADPRKHAVLEGRREVWLRISDHLHLTQDQLYGLYAGKNVNVVPRGPIGEEYE